MWKQTMAQCEDPIMFFLVVHLKERQEEVTSDMVWEIEGRHTLEIVLQQLMSVGLCSAASFKKVR